MDQFSPRTLSTWRAATSFSLSPSTGHGPGQECRPVCYWNDGESPTVTMSLIRQLWKLLHWFFEGDQSLRNRSKVTPRNAGGSQAASKESIRPLTPGLGVAKLQQPIKSSSPTFQQENQVRKRKARILQALPCPK